MARLISDGGGVIVGRRTASWTWGQFEVTLPEGDSQVEQDQRIADGYVYRPDDRETGRLDLTWVRADVNLNMNAEKSDLEATLDAASRRVSGRLYYTRELKGPQLGRSIPGKHYKVGQVIELLLWTKIVLFPVAAIRVFSTPDQPIGYAVQIGDQPLRDPVAQRKRIAEHWTQIMTERRRASAEAAALQKQAKTDRQQTQQISSTMTTVQTLQGKQETNLSITEEGLREVFHMSTDLYDYASGSLTLTGLKNQMYRRRDALGVLLLGWESTT